eukprot:COSAG01_NODE_4606_length_4884_cov_3.073981_7_plen_193_part_00
MTEADILRCLEKLKPSQRLSRLPGSAVLCQKRPFALMMNAACKREPSGRLGFWPRTWVLPDDAPPDDATFKAEGPMLWKPSDASQGDGIVLLHTAEDLRRKLADHRGGGSAGEAVVQRYLPRPMLLDGLKFDLRIYVLVLSLAPLRVFVCREGLVRVCTQPYEQPSRRNSHKLSAHLTNYSVNKCDPRHIHT